VITIHQRRRRTDRRHAIASASRGKNDDYNCHLRGFSFYLIIDQVTSTCIETYVLVIVLVLDV